jgi:hypothetical protein
MLPVAGRTQNSVGTTHVYTRRATANLPPQARGRQILSFSYQSRLGSQTTAFLRSISFSTNAIHRSNPSPVRAEISMISAPGFT